MRRTNIYLEEDQLRILKHIAVEEGRSFTEVVRQALREFIAGYTPKVKRAPSTDEWGRRIENLLTRVRRRTSVFPPEEIEADITAASQESRRQRSHATRPR